MRHSWGHRVRPVRGLRRAVGVRTVWSTLRTGEFHCPGCGGDRDYRLRAGSRRLTVLGVPLPARGGAGPVVECAACERHFAPECLDTPTTARLSALLREAVHTVALAVLHAGGAASPAVRETALSAVRGAGYESCSEEQLLTLLAALDLDTGRLPARPGTPHPPAASPTAPLATELHATLTPLAPLLTPPGRGRILLQAAAIALADGPYTPAEHETLSLLGPALLIPPQEAAHLLTAARTLSS
ncbi:TerB family tellurite resistance protein [Streptomyces polyrhachis]|uniref:TerB family tellurite resistance protein n=1 Tax=Streptomyces polyrhachis TaxID=1282885 RepID=A0ABW2GIU3_9ACTN